MKVIRLSCLLTIGFFLNSKGQTNPRYYKSGTDAHYISVKASNLNRLYKLSTSGTQNQKNEAQLSFFNEFPNSFKELSDLYGYPNDKPAVLYKEYVQHIGLFNKLSIVNKTSYYNKIIKIAIGGRWDADAIGDFQQGLNNRVENNPELTVSILKTLDDNTVKSFWYFYFDGPHPAESISSQLKTIKVINNHIYQLMIVTHHQVLTYAKANH
jgi:hypothetical protein